MSTSSNQKLEKLPTTWYPIARGVYSNRTQTETSSSQRSKSVLCQQLDKRRRKKMKGFWKGFWKTFCCFAVAGLLTVLFAPRLLPQSVQNFLMNNKPVFYVAGWAWMFFLAIVIEWVAGILVRLINLTRLRLAKRKK